MRRVAKAARHMARLREAREAVARELLRDAVVFVAMLRDAHEALVSAMAVLRGPGLHGNFY